ncbi:glycosyltransferase [Arthrobacter crystallopoietes]|uniref:glycosyltransferase n=1 Tax=Crystallibacter crystallopoietes TaxID=37928 RepID=UPI001ABDFB5A|nr:glycosyltransferase family 2 protein [Arthrobacter crystallopoietes]QTG82517.1 glycosyltransferase family 2 protein [Arthrobacter crystallopoietes]
MIELERIQSTTAQSGPDAIRHVVVVVPVRNEEELLAGCIGCIRHAMDRLEATRPDLTAALTVVLDGCTDGSAAIARAVAAQHGSIQILEADYGSVGAARAAGTTAALERVRNLNGAMEAVWIACTDADTLVPGNWLTAFVGLANTGADAVTGTVEPDPAQLDAKRLAAWHHRHGRSAEAAPVHGANLGIRASAYLAAGGFRGMAEHEDVRLVEDLRSSGAIVRSSRAVHAVTSGRLEGRTPGGFAGYLAAL